MARDSSAPDDDWAPLTRAQRTSHPGEQLGELAQRRADAELSGLLGAGPSGPLAEASADEEAARALAALREQIASSGTASSLTASVQDRVQRARRRQARAAAARGELSAPYPAGAPAPASPEFEVDSAADLDERELDPWFLALPEVEQARLRAAWSSSRHRFDAAGKAARARAQRAAWQGALAFAVNALLLTLVGSAAWRVLLHAPVGACAGLLGIALGGERFHFMAAGALSFGLLEGACLLSNPFLLYGMLFAIATMGVVGMDREMRASGGERDA